MSGHDSGAPSLTALEAQVRRRDPDRYFSALFAPQAQRGHLVTLYAFNDELAHIGEAVKEPMIAAIRRQWWREAVEAAASGAPRRHDVLEALTVTLRQTPLTASDLIALIDAREADDRDVQFAQLADLTAYAGATSGALTRLAARALGGDEDGRAIAAGTAFGLIGLIRALPARAAQGKLTLPEGLLAREGLRAAGVLAHRGGGGLVRILKSIAAEADAQLRLAQGPVRNALPALLPAALCRLYSQALARAQYDVFHASTEVALWRKQLALFWAASRGRI